MSAPLTRGAFEELPLRERFKFVRAGGRIVDDPMETFSGKFQPPENHVTRARFDRLSEGEKRTWLCTGGKVCDKPAGADDD